MKTGKRLNTPGREELLQALNDICDDIGLKEFTELSGVKKPNIIPMLRGDKYISTDKMAEIAINVGLDVQIVFSSPSNRKKVKKKTARKKTTKTSGRKRVTNGENFLDNIISGKRDK